MKINTHKVYLLLSLFVLLSIASCADVTEIQECVGDSPYGFLGGLWHGMIAPVSFILSLFMDEVAMYAVNNNGSFYDFGFVLGAGILFGSSKKARRKK